MPHAFEFGNIPLDRKNNFTQLKLKINKKN